MPCYVGMFVACPSQFQFLCSSLQICAFHCSTLDQGCILIILIGARQNRVFLESCDSMYVLIIHYGHFTSAPARFSMFEPIVLQTTKPLGFLLFIVSDELDICILERTCCCRCRVLLLERCVCVCARFGAGLLVPLRDAGA